MLISGFHTPCRNEGGARIASLFCVTHGARVRAGGFTMRPGAGSVSEGTRWRKLFHEVLGRFTGGAVASSGPHPPLPAPQAPLALTSYRRARQPTLLGPGLGRGGERACSRTTAAEGPTARRAVGAGWGAGGLARACCLAKHGSALDGRGRGPASTVRLGFAGTRVGCCSRPAPALSQKQKAKSQRDCRAAASQAGALRDIYYPTGWLRRPAGLPIAHTGQHYE